MTKTKTTHLPPMPSPDELLELVRLELIDRNAADPEPRPICAACKFPIAEPDEAQADDVFLELCYTCAARELDGLIRGVVRNLGRRATLKILTRLAK